MGPLGIFQNLKIILHQIFFQHEFNFAVVCSFTGLKSATPLQNLGYCLQQQMTHIQRSLNYINILLFVLTEPEGCTSTKEELRDRCWDCGSWRESLNVHLKLILAMGLGNPTFSALSD